MNRSGAGGFARDLEVARAVGLEAAALVRRYKGSEVVVDRKTGDEPVTEADRAASELIVRRLRAAFPDDAILSEELPDDGARRTWPRVWMIDPIDGTKDFIRGETGFACMIGLCVDARPKLGVVAQPSTGRTYCGIAGGDAWVEEADGSRRPLCVSAVSGPPGIRLVSSKSHRSDRTRTFCQALGITDEINVGGVGLKVGLVAEGTRDLYIYPGQHTKLWDTCGPEAILLAAGGTLTDVRGQRLVYDGPLLGNPRGVLATNGILHRLVLDTLAPLLPAP